MWIQPTDPLGNLVFSSMLAAVPIALLAALLLTRKVSGLIASVLALAAALVIAIFGYGMPMELAGLSAAYGMSSGLLPIGWIVLNAVFLYNLSVESGSFVIIRDSIESVTADRRLQALLIAFCFGAFLEGAAGFGAPVAITAGMLVGLGFDALYAAGICLIANTAPVAFGAIGIAVITAGHVANIDPNVVSSMIGRQLPFVALLIPLWLVVLIAGWRGAREVWPALLVAGVSYAVTMFFASNYLGPTLPDILSSIVSLMCLVALLSIWRPKRLWRFPHESAAQKREDRPKRSRGDLLRAWTPYVLLIICISNWAMPGQQSILGKTTAIIPFGDLSDSIISNGHPIVVTYSFPWLAAAGTAILFAALLTALLQRIPLRRVVIVARNTLKELTHPLATIATVVGFAYVANYSGMSATLAAALSRTGVLFPLLSPFLGWLGVFLTGSDTSSNALFSGVQSKTAQSLGLNPVLTVGANSSGGVAAKMISPQSIAVAAASTNLVGREGELFRRTILHSIGIVSIVAVITYVQAYFVPWVIPRAASDTGAAVSEFGMGSAVFVVCSIIALIGVITVNIRRSGSAHV